MADFKKFAKAVYVNFVTMSKDELFVVDVSGDELYAAYINAFPEGSNPIYKTRTEHDCSCCKNFIRNVGNVVRIDPGSLKLCTVWDDLKGIDYPYDVVAQQLRDLVVSKAIVSVFRTSERKYGAEENHQRLEDGRIKKWNHFHADISQRHFSLQSDAVRGPINQSFATLKRGLTELTSEAISTVLDLIKGDALYRGAEHYKAVKGFQELHEKYRRLPHDRHRDAFLWLKVAERSPACGFRNSVIGTLAQDLSEGLDLELAVKAFEKKVAPENYKRTTALITPRMVEDAMKTIAELDLEDALQRRLASISDVTINNVLWASNDAKSKMKSGIETLLLSAAKTHAPKDSKAIDIGIDEFVKTVIPKTSAMELYVENAHVPNFVTLTAPVHPGACKLFKWDNEFGWSYDGNITDSIKERVKAAGGCVDAQLRISLSWFNHDDLDLHCDSPDGLVYFGAKKGILDVDMNAGRGTTRKPVENMAWQRARDGVYKIIVDQFSKRESSDVGFVIEIENNGVIYQFSHDKAATGRHIKCGWFSVKNGVIDKLSIDSKIMKSGVRSVDKWGVSTEKFVPVVTMMNSPNFWDGAEIGNKHWIFVLEGCKTDAPARGIYNEFLRADLDKHRKVFEVLGDKTKCEVVPDQLSGLGFSSTRKDTVKVRVDGGRIYNVKF